MKKLDWYIFKKFYATFIFVLLLMLLVILVVDYSEKSDDFVKSNQSFGAVLRNYYAGFIPNFISLVFHLFVFISVIFFTSKLANQTEIIPILASGVSYNRFLRPYIIGSTILAILLWVASNSFIPKSSKMQADFKAKYVDVNLRVSNIGTNYYSKYLKIDSNTYAGIKQYDTASKSASQFFYHTVKNNRLYKNLRGTTFKWDTINKRKDWRIDNVVERVVSKNKTIDSFYSTTNKKFNFKPDDIKYDEYVKDKLTTTELKNFIALEKKRGSDGINKLQVELYRRGATAFAVIILTLIGVFIASRKTRGGIGMQLAVGILIAFLYILLDKFSSVFASSNKLSPFVAAWLPNFIFIIVAVVLYKKAQK
jgi:lipopolysaccharide export system permease protein